MINLMADESLIDSLQGIAKFHETKLALHSPSLTATPSRLTYGELLTQTALRSRALAAYGGAPGDRIAILMRHDVDQITALLSVLQAGRTVVVLNPTDAQVRLRSMVEDAAPALMIADTANFQLADAVAQGICPSVIWDEVSANGSFAPTPGLEVRATAFIVYTSGSAGRPKGVMLDHQQVMHNALRLSTVMELTATDRVAQLASLSGLHGVNNLWCALLRGTALLPFPVMERGVTGLADWMLEHGITAFSASTSLFRSFMTSLRPQQQLTPVRVVRIGGELATSDDVLAFRQHFAEESVLINTLASSEAGNVTYLRCARRDAVPDGPLAVGRPFDGIELEIVDANGRRAATGEAGQIIVKSRYVAQGYWRDEALTTERFFREPSGISTLRSGDWGRINSDGILEFLGRLDKRIKIHGWSVELDEVEWAVSRVPGVERVAICAFEGVYGTELAAYVVPRSGPALMPATLRRAIRELLPPYMVPAVLQIVDDLPLMPHGKVDRAKLLEILPPAEHLQPDTGFETETETLVASIWSEAFGLQSIHRDDKFFELGGDSLTASVIAARIYCDTGAELDLGAFGEYPTVASQAGLIDQIRGEKSDEFHIQRVSGERSFPLSFAQDRVWQFCQTESGAAAYSKLKAYRLTGPLDIDVLRRCMDRLVERHEPLRTTFHHGENGPLQVVHPSSGAALNVVDVSTAADLDRAVDEQISLLGSKKLVLDRGPLMKFSVLKVAYNQHLLLRVAHHMLLDRWASELYFDELADLYRAETSGRNVSAAGDTKPQYGDYAIWQRRLFGAESAAAQRLFGWWLQSLDMPPEPIDWPAKRPQPAQVDPSEGYLRAGIERATWQEMATLAGEEHVTIFCPWLAAFSVFLCAHTSQREVIVGSYVSNRKRLELQTMLGDFSNLVSLRFRCAFPQTFRSWLMTVRNTLAGATAHSEAPYEELRGVFARNGKLFPEVRTIAVLSEPLQDVRFANISIVGEELPQKTLPWGFTFEVIPGIFDCGCMFDASIYDTRAVRDDFAQWKRLVEALLRDPDSPMEHALLLANFAN